MKMPQHMRSTSDALERYRTKRDFSATAEPVGKQARRAGHSFVVQLHDARRKHFDFRIEMDGVLKSWAVTKGPSANPATRRLAVRTEDHPVEYRDFEGVIAPKQYGAGSVMIWDAGFWEPLQDDPAAALEVGSLKFALHGKRMRGEWALVRMKPDGKRVNWLLIKHRDDFAEDTDKLSDQFTHSAVSGRSMQEIANGAPSHTGTELPHSDALRGAKSGPSRAPGESAFPRFVKPQLCDTRQAPPSGEDWIGEIKYDGYRLQVHIANGRARALTRSGRDWSEKFPGIVAAAAKIEAKEAILDGEAVVFDSDGISDFKALVAGFEKGSKHSVYQAFDLLALDGKDLTGKALLERKKMLKALLSGAPRTIRYTEHVAGDLQVLFERVVAGGAEGIIAKRATAPYRSGRGSAWQKIKGEARTDVTVVGFRPSHRGRPFASLLTAREENGGLRFAGAVGTGFSMQQMQDIKTRLRAHELKNPWRSLLDSDRAPADAIWVRPYYEAEVAIASWTRDGSMRHARFLALKKSPVKSRSSKRPKAKKIETRPAKTPTTPRGRSSHIDPFGITVTSADRIIFPAAAVTKGEIAAYYAKIAPKMFPFVANRPVSVLRAPEGISGETFFQRHPARGMDEGLETFKSGGKSYFAICEKSGLVEIAQFGGVEIHGWGVTRDALGSPDRVVFDLDPDETVPFAEVKNVAIRFRDALAAAGLASYAMVTGGKGVHVIVPLDATQAWAAVRAFSSGFAHKMAAADLSLVAVASKQKRKGKIFVDWLRNTPKATAVAPYSLRAREGAAVAMPVTWSELKRVNAADQFHMDDALRRKMPWTDYEDNRKPIPKGVLDLLATEGN